MNLQRTCRARRGLPSLNRRRPMWPALVACILSWGILAVIIKALLTK